MRPRFLAVFILLSLDTILLLAIAILFFTDPPVRLQMQYWAGQLAPDAVRAAELQPQLNQAAPAPTSTSTPAPNAVSALPLAGDISQAPEQEQAPVGPTLEPIFQVVEEPPPDGNLVIPSLDIDHPLVPVGIREQEWDLSTLGDQVGWLQTTGAHPGDDLAMVLIGHITLPYPGGPGPFLNLSSLQPGDFVGYRTGQKTYIYEVKERFVVTPEKVDSLYKPDGEKLLLVTCTSYNALERRYDRRMVVEAELVSVEE